jgi:eukaryotic-like serine/threonine-protein kinase
VPRAPREDPAPPGRRTGTTEQGLRFGRRLGAGGLGDVYEAAWVDSGARVAVKTLLPRFHDVREAVRRLEREARTGNLLDHPALVDTRAYGMLDDGSPYLVMELVDGRDLASVIRAGRLGARRALGLAGQLLDGLGHAHAFGVLHRDLKPENVMLVDAPGGEQVKILDLGLAKLFGVAAEVLGADKLTQTGMISGTPLYMAPEQALGQPVSVATDLYAVGLIVYEMLAGAPPFVAADALGVLKLHVTAPVPRLSATRAAWAPPALDQLLARALAKPPAARFASASEMRAAIAAVGRAAPAG